MKIVYDHQMFLIQKYGGISKYFCELIKNLPVNTDFYLSVLFSTNQHLKEDYNFFKKINIPLPQADFKGRGFLLRNFYFLNKLYSTQIITSRRFDIFHPTFYDPYFLGTLKKPYVLTVHDLTEFKFRQLAGSSVRRNQMEQVIQKASRLIAISENTKADLIETLNINPEKIDVVYHGFNKSIPQEIVHNRGDYILFVGRRAEYKNFKLFTEALSVILKKDADLHVICVGEPFTSEELNDLIRLNLLDKIKAMEVNEAELNSLYSGARLFVYPSLYEGFGMPILEAFANNCPVCLSDSSCFPEIAGQAGLYFDPLDKESMIYAIEKGLYNSELTLKLVIEGRRKLSGFSWEKTAAETVKTYEKVI